MPNLKDIKRRIQSVITTQQTTNAMKLVSAAKLKRAQDAIQRFRPYANQLRYIVEQLATGAEIESPYFEERPIENVLIVLITSNKGLAGAFNSAIIKVAEEHIAEHYAQLLQQQKVFLLCVGKKGFDYFKRRSQYRIVEQKNFDVYGKRIAFEKVEAVANYVMQGFLEKRWDKVELIYNGFKNVATQYRRVETYLPVRFEAKETKVVKDYIFEPDKHLILEQMVPKILRMYFYNAILDSHAAEHGARMVAMDNATSNAEELLKELRLQYNKARQEAITKEILEIVSGANALKG